MQDIKFTLNGKEVRHKVDEAMPLLYLLRNECGLNGPKYGCGLEQCGSCMVLIDGKNKPTCRLPAVEVDGTTITTLEGLADGEGRLHSVQSALLEEQAAQCGYCTNGVIMAGVSLFAENSSPDEETIRDSVARNLCRCGTGSRVVRAFNKLARKGEDR